MIVFYVRNVVSVPLFVSCYENILYSVAIYELKYSIEFEIRILYGRARSNSNKSEFRIVILAEQ